MEEEKNILHGPKESVTKYEHHSMGQLILNQLVVHGSKIAQVNAYTGEEQTFQYILERTKKLAVALKNKGLQTNDCVAICSENNTEFCMPVCATLYLGATVCPLNPLYTQRELIHALNISRPKFIFLSELATENVCKIISQLTWSPELIMLLKSDRIQLPDISSLIENITVDKNFQACPVDIENHVAVICCSSGTTGMPKGVMLTDKNLLTVLGHLTISSAEAWNKSVTTLGLLPFFHIYSFTVLLIRLIFGNRHVILSRFSEKDFLRTIEQYKIEFLTLVPPLMVFLAKHPLVDRYNLSSVREIWCGAAPLPEKIAAAVVKRLNLRGINQGYGLTETTLAVISSASNPIKRGSVGKLVPGVSAKVVPIDEEGSARALGPNCEGELCFKGDIIMKGYCNDKKATARTIDKDGWLHSGDVGYYDTDGYFYIVDRLKELIKYKGFQVPPAELEAILLSCPGVNDAAVVGMPNEEAGELPFAFVVKQPKSRLTEDDVIKYVNERVSSHKRLRGGVKFVDSIPKTPSGKILRRVLRDSLKSKL